MARQVIERILSDLSGKEIKDGQAWTMLLTPVDGRKNPVRLDISSDEAAQFLSKGVEVKRRGRKPGSATRRSAASPARKPAANGRRKRS